MPALADLVQAPTRSEVLDKLLALYRLAGFPVASWQPGSVARHLTEAAAATLADLGKLIATIARGGFLDTAEGAWLDLLAENLFNERRKPAVSTRGLVQLTDAAAAGPFVLDPGTMWISNRARTRRFRNVDGGTLARNASIAVLFEAEQTGAAWNVGADELDELLTPGGTGIVVTNAAGTRGTWITEQGADAETDRALRQRCRDKWATLGSGATDAAYRYWVTSASSEITRVDIAGDPLTGTVVVQVGGPSGPVSGAAFDAVTRVLAERRPLTVITDARNAAVHSVVVEGILYLRPGADPELAVAVAKEAVDAYARESAIAAVIYRARLLSALMSAPGVQNVELLAPTVDVTLASGRVFVPVYALRTLVLPP